MVLPPVSEALGLIDVAYVNNEGNPTPGSIRRAIQIMVDHISYQNVQLSRVEDILAAYGNPTQPGGTVWTKLAGKAEASRVQQLEEQVDEQLNVMCAMRSKQSESDLRAEEMAARLDLLREQVAALEAKLGSGPPPSRLHAQVCPAPSHPGDTAAHAAAAAASVGSGAAQWSALGGEVGGPSHHGSSVMERLAFMERRVEAMGAAVNRGEENMSSTSGRVRDLEPKIEGQLSNLRSDIKQALALAAASARSEAEAEACSRSKETEKRMMSKMHGLEQAFEARMASVSTKVGTSLSQELDKRFLGLYDHVDLQVSGLRTDLDRVQSDKADTTSLENYTARVSALFEQVAGALGADVREASESCSKSVAALQGEITALASNKADKVAAGSVMDAHAAALGALRDNLTALERAVAAQPDAVEGVRAEARALAKDLEQAQRSISGLNSAMAATGSAIELQSHKTGSLSHKLQQAVADFGRMRGMLYGDSAPGGVAPEGGAAAGAPLSLSARVGALEAGASEVAARLASKAEEGAVREAERRLATLGRQVESATEGVRALTQSSGKRVDEHAAAIQRLTLAVNSHMDERPTTSMVRHMIEASTLEGGEKLGSALLPVWDAVKALQAGLRDSINEARNAAGLTHVLQQHQEELRLRVAGEKGAMAALASRAVAEEVLPLLLAPSTGLGARMEAVEADMRCARAQLEVASELQEKQNSRSTALEDQLSTHAASLRQASAAQKGELLSVIRALQHEASERAEGLEAAMRSNTLEIEAVRESIPSLEETRTAAEVVARREIGRHKDQEETRWQAWLEQYARQLERLPSKGELQDRIAEVMAIAKQACVNAETASAVAAGAEGRAAETADQRVQGCELALSANVARIEALETFAASAATHQALLSLERALHDKADLPELEARCRRCEESAAHALELLRSDLQAEVSKKLDMRTFLASSASANATAVAAAAAGAYNPNNNPNNPNHPTASGAPPFPPGPPPAPLPRPPFTSAPPPPPTHTAPPPSSHQHPPFPPISSLPTSKPPLPPYPHTATTQPTPPPPLYPPYIYPPAPHPHTNPPPPHTHAPHTHATHPTAPTPLQPNQQAWHAPPRSSTASQLTASNPAATAAGAGAGVSGGAMPTPQQPASVVGVIPPGTHVHAPPSSSSAAAADRAAKGEGGSVGGAGKSRPDSPTRSGSSKSSGSNGGAGARGGGDKHYKGAGDQQQQQQQQQQKRQEMDQQAQLLRLLQQQQQRQQQEEAQTARARGEQGAPGAPSLYVPPMPHTLHQPSSRPPPQPSSPCHQQQVLGQIAAAESFLASTRHPIPPAHTTTTIHSPGRPASIGALPPRPLPPQPVTTAGVPSSSLGLGSAAATAAISRLGERLKSSQGSSQGEGGHGSGSSSHRGSHSKGSKSGSGHRSSGSGASLSQGAVH